MSTELKYLHALHLALRGEPLTLIKTLGRFPDAASAWQAHAKSEIDPDREMEKLIKDGVWTIEKFFSSGTPSFSTGFGQTTFTSCPFLAMAFAKLYCLTAANFEKGFKRQIFIGRTALKFFC